MGTLFFLKYKRKEIIFSFILVSLCTTIRSEGMFLFLALTIIFFIKYKISKEIIKIIDENIKPAVASDGGNIMFESYDTTTQKVNVILQGACSGCPSSTVTLKSGIETMLKDMLPGKISEVNAING